MYHLCRIFMQSVSVFQHPFVHNFQIHSCLSSLTKPRRHRIFEVPAACHSLRQEKKLTAQTLPCCVYHHSRHPVREYRLHNRLKVPCLDSQQHTVRKHRILQVPLRGANVYGYGKAVTRIPRSVAIGVVICRLAQLP